MNWNSYPFVRFTLFLTAGILLAWRFPYFGRLPLSAQVVLLLASVLLSVITAVYLRSYKYRWLSGIAAGFSLVLTGVFITTQNLDKNTDHNIIKTNKIWVGEVVAEPDLKARSVKTILKLTPAYDSSKSQVKAVVFFKRDSLSETLKPGDILLINAVLKNPAPPKNPYSFDYSEFLKRKGIPYISFVNKGSFKKIKSNGNTLKYFPYRLRKKLLDVLKNNGLKGDEYAVASAILLGYDKLMDADTEKAYAAAGAVHVLCVSGLHVGIIYLVFGFLLSFLGKTKKERILKTVILLLIIWFYAVITGLAPSVWRASVMISLFIIGNGLKRELNPYNTLAASAFILLVINPMLLFDVGFQLSYAAVLGILVFYKPLNNVFFFKNKILKTLWSVTAVSVSAQAGAFPVAAHYFHAFPLYFLLTNIAVFALAYIIIIAGMLFLILSPFNLAASFIGIFLSASVYLMNLIVKYISALPCAQIQNIYFPWFKVAVVYAIILSLFFWLWKKDAKYLQTLLLSIVILAGFQTVLKLNRLKRSEMVVFSTNKGLAVDVNRAGHHLLLADSLLLSNPGQLDYAVSDYLLHNGLDKNPLPLENGNYKGDFFVYKDDFLLFKNVKIYFAGKKIKHYPRLTPKINIDFLVINGIKTRQLPGLFNGFNIKNIVIPASVSKYMREKVKNFAKEKNICCYDLAQNGAFVY